MSVTSVSIRLNGIIRGRNCIKTFSLPIRNLVHLGSCKNSLFNAEQGGISWCLLQHQQYASKARSVKFPPTKHLDFDFSGDVEKQKELDPNAVLSIYKPLEYTEEFQNAPESVKKLLTVEFASGREKLQHRKIVTYEKVNEITGDGLNLEKQIAIMTVKIQNLIPYCLAFRKNKRAKAHLYERIQMRRRLLKLLREVDYDRFMWVLKEFKVVYVPQQKNRPNLSRKQIREKDAEEKMLSVRKKKMQEFQEVIAKEKEEFEKHKAEVMAEIERLIDDYDLDREKIKKDYETVQNESAKEVLQ